MDRTEKKQLRDHIGEHLDVSGTRLTDDEALFLCEFIDGYARYRGHVEVRRTSRRGWSSDGRYTREETYTDTFTDEIGIRRDYEYRDDDGQTGRSSNKVTDARGILDWFGEHPRARR